MAQGLEGIQIEKDVLPKQIFLRNVGLAGFIIELDVRPRQVLEVSNGAKGISVEISRNFFAQKINKKNG